MKEVEVISQAKAKRLASTLGLKDELYATGKFSKKLKDNHPVGSTFETHINTIEYIYLVRRQDSDGPYWKIRCLS